MAKKKSAAAKQAVKNKSVNKYKIFTKFLVPILIIVTALVVAVLIVGHNRNGKQLDAASVVACPTASQDFKCWEKHYQSLVDIKSPEAAFADLKTAYSKSSYIVGQCHQLTHRIGREAVKKYPTVAQSYKHGDNFCWSGYYHGVMEAISIKLGHDGVIAQMNNICAEMRSEGLYSFYHYNCVHGLGHGVMAITNNQMFDSLRLCDKLNDNWEAQSCYGGVFMENVMLQQNPNTHTDFLKADQPMYPCTAVDYKYKEQCYLMQTSYALQLNGYNFASVFKQCASVDNDFVATCYQSAGRDASGSTNSNTASTIAHCAQGQDEVARTNCAIGAVKDFISYYHSDTKAKELCSAFQEPSVSNVCLSTAVEYYKTF